MYENASNFLVKVRGEYYDTFEQAMQLAFRKHKAAFGWNIINGKFILYWTDDDKNITPFPYEMGCAEVLTVVWTWLLKNNPVGDYPDIDGTVEKGFLVSTCLKDMPKHNAAEKAWIVIVPDYLQYHK